MPQHHDTNTERLRAIVSAMPEKPGSYQFYDAEGTIIYVGKAKNLKRRVSSYFHKEVDRFKTKVLVSKICDISYTVVRTEADALLLENNLIKRYNPRYNVLLKDGKTYPSICVTNEPYPRIFKTRQLNRRTGTFFGPYSHIPTMVALLDIIKQLYHPRTCHHAITAESIASGRQKECLDFHIHACMAPCTGRQTQADYLENIRQAREILKGNTREVCRQLRERMEELAGELRFEEAEEVKRRYLLLENFAAKSEVVSHTIDNIDVFGINLDDKNPTGPAYINYLHVSNGAITQSFTYEYRRQLAETAEELLCAAIPEIRQRLGSRAREIVVEAVPEWQEEGCTYTVPQRGDKRHLLELSQLNCRQYRVDRLKQAEKLNPEQRQTRLLKALQTALGLAALPMHIECFDNSNISGTDAVAGCVVYKGAKPSKKDYRKYTIKTVLGPDDYASMREVVTRRYRRMRDEGEALPDLILCDGGAGQMSVVREAVEDDLGLHIAIAGLAKDDKHRTRALLFGAPPQTVGLKPDGELFRFLTGVQDEVHRFAIAFHRDKRSKSALHSALDDITGVGPKTRDALLRAFKTVKGIREAAPERLEEVVGKARAQAVREALGGKN